MMCQNALSLSIAGTKADMEAVFRIRRQVFVLEQEIPPELDRDGRDEESIHIVATIDGKPVGTGRLTPTGAKSGGLARIAVLPAFRGRGYGERIIAQLETQARLEGLVNLHLNAHEYLAPYYRALGYNPEGSTMIVASHRLLRMEKQLVEDDVA